MRIYIIFPSLRYVNGINLGKFKVKSTVDHFHKEQKKTREELIRIASFFSQRENKPIDSFSYLILDLEDNMLMPILEKIKRNLEVFRFLAFHIDGRGISYEHTVPYVVIPNKTNPHKITKGGLVYGYDISVDFDKQTFYQSFYTDLKRNPFFNLNIYSDTPHNQVDTNEYRKIVKKANDKAIRSLSWYNTTYTSHLPSGSDNLLKISNAFETLLKVDRNKGRITRLKELTNELKSKKIKRLLPKQKTIASNYIQEKIGSQLSGQILQISGSKKIESWFKNYLYPTASAIRHGDEIELRPSWADSGKSKKSLYYGKDASHDFLSNIDFGRRLFRYIFLEIHFPASDLLKNLEVEQLEKKLEADEKRLKKIEKYVSTTKVGSLDWKELGICSDLGASFSGDKMRIFALLQRLLAEIRLSFPKVWQEIGSESEKIVKAPLKSIKFDDYESFKPYYSAIIEIGSILDSRKYTYNQESDFKLFYIVNFISYALHRLP